MVCGELSCSRFCSSGWCYIMDSRSVIRISDGEPGFRTPGHVVDAMKRAMDEGHIRQAYTQSMEDIVEGLERIGERVRIGCAREININKIDSRNISIDIIEGNVR